jgi:hypothetical protein
MRKTMLVAAALSMAGAAAGGTVALAQDASQAPSVSNAAPADDDTQSGAQPRGPHQMRMGWWHRHHGEHGPGERGRGMPFMPGTFGLFAPRPDKNLSPADVQQIAQAILLWNGNHDWKVAQVQPGQNHEVTFAYVTGDGTTIAKFAINQDTGRITRVG